VVLVGGQAVAFWARFLGVHADGPSGELLASKDIDFEGRTDAARQAAILFGGRARIPTFDDHGPNTGVVVFDDSDGVERRIDFLVAPLGLDPGDVRKTAVELEIGGGDPPVSMWIMHPEPCMESRICNVQIPGIDGGHAMSQLTARSTSPSGRDLLDDESLPERHRVRAVLSINERIFLRCVDDRNFRKLYEWRGVDPFAAVLFDDERLSAEFRARRYPQMVERLAKRRRARS
jgi:hypothetical protein